MSEPFASSAVSEPFAPPAVSEPFVPPAVSEPLGRQAAPVGEVSTPSGDISARHNVVPGSNQASARSDEVTVRPGEGTARPPEAAVQPPETSARPAAAAQPPEVEVPYPPAASLARRDVTTTGPHATHMPGTQWAATSAAPPWAQGPTAYTTAHPEVHRPEVMPATLSSQDLLSQIAAMKQAKLRSNAGMRGALNKVGFNLGLSPSERRFEDRRSRIRRPLTRTYQIAVLSVKGGVGRTTITATLGSTFSHLRPDRVVAIDANPDFGDLATRTSRHPYGLTLRDLAYAQSLDAFSAVHSYTAINSADLAVVASPWTTESVEALSGPEFAAATDILRRHYNLMLVDCGTGVLTSATSTVMQSSDAVVVVTPATVGGVKGAVATLNWLNMHGFPHLVENSIVAIVHQRPDKPIVEVAEIEKLFATVSRPTCVVPYDQHLAEGAEIDLRLLDKETEVVFEELAAALADNFSGFHDGRHAEPGGYR
ncbi:MinD/ParA family ATP-binding protein [Nocardia sp. GAS34]|uniref:MinD/ParA family ATP-binding protein n=1 Tax=unclassified Nocardia TaxID=2637762 RepID=UPI003D2278C6